MSTGYGPNDTPGMAGPPGPLDSTFANTNIVVLIIFSVCCGIVAFILGLIGMLTAKSPKAKSNATLVVIISGVLMVIGIVLNVVVGVGGAMLGGGAAPGR